MTTALFETDMERLYELYRFYRIPIQTPSNFDEFPHEPSAFDFRLFTDSHQAHSFNEVGNMFTDCPAMELTYCNALNVRTTTTLRPIGVIMAEAAGRNLRKFLHLYFWGNIRT